MGLLYFFDNHIIPRMLKGTQIMNPSPTGILSHGVSCIREGNVNLWFYTKDNHTIAVDAGHLNETGLAEDFLSIGIDAGAIRHVLLTHADADHCGGVDIKAKKNLYPNAQVYIGKKEEDYLKKMIPRAVTMGKNIYNDVQLHTGCQFLEDEQILDLDGISVRAVCIPGHTAGHMCYIVDDTVLFSGDCLAVNQQGGYAFWDFFCQFPEQNKQSLKHLKEVVENSGACCACTGHSGFVSDIKNLFAHIDTSAHFGKDVPFDETAPKDVCKRK